MKEIVLSNGQVAIVDDEDFEKVNQRQWYKGTRGYAEAKANGKSVFMHRLILDAPVGMQVDHANQDKLDNRKCNIRLATASQNAANRNKRVDSSSYKGVRKKRRKWRAEIDKGGKTHYLGYFISAKKAALAYDMKARELYGEFARPTFPNLLVDENVLQHWREEKAN